jgi:hypothetical protein
MKIFFYLLLLAVAILQGCSASSRTTWYKEGGSQREFDLDSKECDIIAEQQALARSENGRRSNPLLVSELHHRCITAKGWSTLPPGESKAEGPAQTFSLGKLSDSQLSAFDIHIVLPTAARLQSNTRKALGATKTESFFFEAEGQFLNVVLQQSDIATFQMIDYPVNAPYRLYTTGGRDNLRWSAFWGRIGNDWVKGIGSFLRFSNDQRCIIVITGQLAAPDGDPPEGLHLTENQNREMQQFIEQWKPWLEKNTPEVPLARRILKTALGFFKKI